MNRFTTAVGRFFTYLFHFGPRLTWFYIVYPRFAGRKGIMRRHEEIKRWIRKEFAQVLASYKERPFVSELPEEKFPPPPIWVCWLQGEKQMPETVRKCYRSVLANAAGRAVILVTEQNVGDFVSIPAFITEKVRKGEMSRTHYADYLRILLLKNHGGLWIDSTVFVTDEITVDRGLDFYSVRQDPASIYYVSQYRWAVWLLGCSARCGSYMFGCLEELFRTYLSRKSVFVDFFLFDYFIAAMYEELPQVRGLIDRVPYNSTSCEELISLLNSPYDENLMMSITNRSIFHKLTWKKDFDLRTDDGRETFFGVINRLYE
ncbi:capsular polysaccharide synthesis protein [uncultured Alistipes sp.]|uniref:capsular polysaccharide synthesis protein n=2 Tax=Rikenellaceae TaxID=171550 RepID=UPI0032B1BB00